MATDDDGGDYIDYEAFLAPDFKPATFANSLVLSTNNPNDIPLDLATPLSRVLFDTQEIDSHIDALTTRSSIPLLTHAKTQNDASRRILSELDSQVKSLNDSYAQLEKDVIQKHAEADQVRKVASRLWESLRLSRAVSRCLQLGRQLQLQMMDSPTSTRPQGGDHTALLRCANTILAARELFENNAPGEEGHNLDRITVIQTLRRGVIHPGHDSTQKASETIIRDFSVTGSGTDPEAEDARARLVASLCALYLLSPSPKKNERWTPDLMLQAVELHLRGGLQGGIAALGRGLGQFNGQVSMLEKSLAEVSARCRNAMQLEAVLESARAPRHPLLSEEQLKQVLEKDKGNLLQPVLAYLETGSLASYFWRTLASSLSTRVQEMSQRGSSAARSIRLNRAAVEKSIRECVIRGSEAPETKSGSLQAKTQLQQSTKVLSTSWEREVAVMVGSVMNNIG
ncbi:putative golgi transport complex component cog5 protein [Zalerion maritima]|uniref:Conserved oligomeric Golgi complex subunit 5 n=1 Tax=Zalerion maritima TaxID=339359 RepID=A0AAD5RR05_9PEZI|nr:putative golgi transport complex component cog5 protein [Zalerion maritima]